MSASERIWLKVVDEEEKKRADRTERDPEADVRSGQFLSWPKLNELEYKDTRPYGTDIRKKEPRIACKKNVKSSVSLGTYTRLEYYTIAVFFFFFFVFFKERQSGDNMVTTARDLIFSRHPSIHTHKSALDWFLRIKCSTFFFCTFTSSSNRNSNESSLGNRTEKGYRFRLVAMHEQALSIGSCE